MKKAALLLILCFLICILSACKTIANPLSETGENVFTDKPDNMIHDEAAAIKQEASDFSFTLLEGGTTVEITGYNGNEQELVIPEMISGYQVVSIGDYAFVSNAFLKSVSIPRTVIHIGCNPFLECDSLSNITVAADNSAFESIDGILYSIIEKTLISFPKAKQMEELNIPSGVIAVGSDSCYGCHMSTVTFPETVTSIGDRAFAHSPNLVTINLSGNITSIGISAFGVCQKLASLTIPEGVESIGDWAFCNSLAMQWISLPSTLKFVGKNPFYYSQKLVEINVNENNPIFESVDGKLINTIEHKLICYPMNDFFATKYAIPQGIEIIGEKAFWSCNWGASLKEVSIPDSVVAIEANAFQYSSIEKVNLPEGISFIGEKAFFGCSSLVIELFGESYAEKYCIENNLDYVVIE